MTLAQKGTQALEFASRGWPVFPLIENSKEPKIIHGFKDATIDEYKIRCWWNKFPDANIGIATGQQSGLFVVDIDKKNGVDGNQAADEFRLAVIAEVLNFEMWRNDFDRDEFNRKEAGLNLLGLATDAESDNRVYIMFSCADQQKVYDFMSSDNTKQAISDSGVIGEPNMTWWRVP